MNTILGTTASSQSKFVTRYSPGLWFNGTNDSYGGMVDKLTSSDWVGNFGVNYIALYSIGITINNIFYDLGYNELFNAEDTSPYIFRNDGYGLGFSSYIDQLNLILQQYNLRTRFYPAAGNTIAGVINTAENFKVDFEEFAGGPDITTTYQIECYYDSTSDYIDGGGGLVMYPWL